MKTSEAQQQDNLKDASRAIAGLQQHSTLRPQERNGEENTTNDITQKAKQQQDHTQTTTGQKQDQNIIMTNPKRDHKRTTTEPHQDNKHTTAGTTRETQPKYKDNTTTGPRHDHNRTTTEPE